MPDALRIGWGNRLRELRLERGMSQMALAVASGLDKSYYARIERGEVGARGTSDDVRMRIAAGLGVQVADIWSYPDVGRAS